MKKMLAIIATLLLAGCAGQINTKKDPRRGLAPQSPALVSQSESAGTTEKSPVLIRIFKQEHELELWRKDKTGQYVLVQTFPICKFSGELGPKHVRGDRQAPEGFYTITSGQLNYNSIRWLSINTGYPNAFDRYHGSTGSALMIHGGCDSAGCYAIEDGPMQDLFATVRDSLRAGQHSVQLHIFPFRMNSFNMVAHSNYKTLWKKLKAEDFWHQLKAGYDRFEWSHQDLDVRVVNGRYIVK
jgi:murein L,D-transpeptidase YafK